MHNGVDNYTYLTSAPIHRVIVTMAVPTIVCMLVTGLYNMADTFFVGQLDTQSTAAVGVVFSLMFFIQALGFFFGHGSGNYMSRELGAKHKDNAGRMAANGFFFSFVTGLCFAVVGLLFLRPIAYMLGSTPTILPYTERYLGIVLLGAPFFTSSLTINNQLRLQGNASYAMVGIVVGAVLNVGLDPLLIFVFHMGIAGAAVATVIGQVVSAVLLFAMTRRGDNIAIRWSNFRPTWRALYEIFLGGSPSLSRQGLLCIATMLLNHAAAQYGDAAIAGMSIVNRITMLVMAFVIGLGQGFQPVCGFCYGARLFRRLKSGYRFTVVLGTVFLLFISVIGFLISSQVISVFRNDAAVIAVGTVALRWQLCTLPLNATIMASNMLTQTCRKPVRANLLAASRSGLFFVPLILTLPLFWGLTGVEMCQAISDGCSFALTVPIMIYTLRELR
ncbi:MAG: MATE family efflux transporter [Prevotella sp.]|nr:MATE family efflux transporter [Prevotella sp.]